MLPGAEDRGTLGRGVATNAFKHAAPIVQRVGKHVNLRVVPIDELAVEPDLFGCLNHPRVPYSPSFYYAIEWAGFWKWGQIN